MRAIRQKTPADGPFASRHPVKCQVPNCPPPSSRRKEAQTSWPPTPSRRGPNTRAQTQIHRECQSPNRGPTVGPRGSTTTWSQWGVETPANAGSRPLPGLSRFYLQHAKPRHKQRERAPVSRGRHVLRLFWLFNLWSASVRLSIEALTNITNSMALGSDFGPAPTLNAVWEAEPGEEEHVGPEPLIRASQKPQPTSPLVTSAHRRVGALPCTSGSVGVHHGKKAKDRPSSPASVRARTRKHGRFGWSCADASAARFFFAPVPPRRPVPCPPSVTGRRVTIFPRMAGSAFGRLAGRSLPMAMRGSAVFSARRRRGEVLHIRPSRSTVPAKC